MPDIRKNETAKAVEATRAGAREAADQAQDTVQAGIDGIKRVTEEFGKALGLTGQNEELARQASQNLHAITETGSVLLRGFQEVSREWVELAQQRLRKNSEGLARLAQCRNLQDLAAVQSELVREGLHEMIDSTRRIAERSIEVTEEAARTITAEAKKAADRLPRAA